jgi:hypothetical protein
MADTILSNYFDRRALIAVAEILKKPKTFLTNTFFRDSQEFSTKTVDVDLYEGRRRIAAYVRRGSEGQLVEKRGFQTNTFTPPYLKPKVAVFMDDVRKRIPGESIFSDGRIVPEAEAFIARMIDELDTEMISRNIEIQAKQALFDGQVVAYDENNAVLATISYGRNANLTYQTGTRWSANGANPLKTAREASRKTSQYGGSPVNICLMGTDAADYFVDLDTVQKALSKDWSTRGQLAYDLRDNGGIWLGYADGVDYWTLEEYTINPADGTEELAIPAKKALYTNINSPRSILYGGLELKDQPMGARGIKMYEIDDPESTVVQVHSAPLAVDHHPNNTAVVTVLT